MAILSSLYSLIEERLASPSWGRLVRLFEYCRERWLVVRRISADQKDLSDRFCPKPFEHFELNESGSVYLCCQAWLPWRAGNLHSSDAQAIWNSQSAQDVRRSIHDGDFRYCSRTLCPAIQGNTLPSRAEAMKDPVYKDIIEQKRTIIEGTPKYINLANDKSCNLSCPSCRTKRINFPRGSGYELRKRLQDRLVQAFFTKPTDDKFTVCVTGSGDPFASRIFREFLSDLDKNKFPNIKINLQTNGTLFSKRTWDRMSKIHGQIGAVLVSFDAATEGTYQITRRGGDWRLLLRNMEFIAVLRQRGLIEHLRVDFVAQRANFREMPKFIELGKHFSADNIYFSQAVNWGTWSSEEYRDICVWNPDHPEHAEFMQIISQPIFADPQVLLGNLSQYRRPVGRTSQPKRATRAARTEAKVAPDNRRYVGNATERADT